MSYTAAYALAAPLTAFICCAFISFMMKNFKIKTHIRMIIVYVIYARLCFVMEAGGNGIFNADMSTFVMPRFIFRMIAGVFVCVAMYLYYMRYELSERYEERKKNSGKK